VFINGQAVERVPCFKFGGLNITEDFSWTTQTYTVIKKSTTMYLFSEEIIKKQDFLAFIDVQWRVHILHDSEHIA